MNRRYAIAAAAAGAALLGACQTRPAAPPNAVAHATAPAAGPSARCGAPSMPYVASLPQVAGLPDPFTFTDGRRVTSAADWACRRAELAAQIGHYELGDRPGAAPVDAHMEGQDLVVGVTHDGRTIRFPVHIQLPPGGHAPYPALIGIGAVSLNNAELARMGIALITFPNNAIGAQQNAGSRGQGDFYMLYGSAQPAGAITAWSWGVSRLIDALERTPDARIDATHLGVTGCSRNGKGALVAGAFDERIRLTIAQESGAGGAAGWRISDAQSARGENVQTLRQIVTENVWFADSFKAFGAQATRLPFDQHEVMGLIAPRGLLVIENTSMEWLGNQSAWLTPLAARQVWTALGAPDAMGIAQVGGHAHCQLPASQYAYVNAFARRFLLDDAAADTHVLTTDGAFAHDPARDAGPWVNWTTPALR